MHNIALHLAFGFCTVQRLRVLAINAPLCTTPAEDRKESSGRCSKRRAKHKFCHSKALARLLLTPVGAAAFIPSSSNQFAISGNRVCGHLTLKDHSCGCSAPQPCLLDKEGSILNTACLPDILNRAMALQMKEEEVIELLDTNDFKLYPQRWIQLAYLSALAFLSDWVCFSVAAAPETFQATYSHDPASLIDIFLFTNVLFCFLEPAIVGRFGLRNAVVGAAANMALGCLLRSGVPFGGALPAYEQIVLGTVLVGASQPLFQCTPPLLSATWFGSEERALATATAINFNQVGIATAFLVGGAMMNDADGLLSYFGVITASSFVLAIGALVQFQELPPTPPTGSAAARIEAAANPDMEPPNFLVTARELLATPGFLPPLVAFVASIGVSNVVSAFVEETLHTAGFWEQSTIDLAGAGFQAAIVVGGILLGGYVDRTGAYKQVTLACLVGSVLLLLPLGLGGPQLLVLAALIGLGALIGPVQPINAELAVEVAYPADENSIEALQQLCGNLFSALLVPVAERAATFNLQVSDSAPTFHGDTLLLEAIGIGAFAYFTTFDATLKRSAVDCESEDSGRCALILDSADESDV